MVASTRQRGEGDELCAETAAGGDGAEAALEGGDALLEACDCRVREPGVDVAVLLQGEAGRGIRRVIEDIGARLVDRKGAGSGRRIGDVASVDCTRAETIVTISHEIRLQKLLREKLCRRNRRPRYRQVGSHQCAASQG